MEALAEIAATLEASVLVAACIFVRVGAVAFLLPGIGERGIPARVRLGAALAMTWLVAPLVVPLVPEAPRTGGALARVVVAEAVAGLTIGLGFRLLVQVLQIAGTMAASQLSISHVFGSPVDTQPEPTIATFLALGGVAIALASGLHVAAVAALAGLYEVLPLGRFPDAGVLAELATARMAEGFALAFGLAAPFVAIGFAYNLALGAISRAMPQLLVALIGVPLLVLLGLFVLWLALPGLIDRWLGAAGAIFADPLGGLG